MEVRGGRGNDPWLPHMLGHEGTGEVIDIGDGVTKVKIGDLVVLGWIKGSGIDSKGAVYTTQDGMVINSGGVTTFSNYTVASENRLVILPAETPLDLGVLYGCALPTGAGIIMNEIQPSKGASIVIVGLGGVGMSALIASTFHAPNLLIAIDIEDEKLNLAEELGATHIINSTLSDPIKELLEITNGKGVDYAVEAAGLSATISMAFNMVKRNGGKCVFASHPANGELVCLDPFEMICGKILQGSWGGSSSPDRDVPVFGEYYRQGKLALDRLVSKTYTLANINDALNELEYSHLSRPIIKMSHN